MRAVSAINVTLVNAITQSYLQEIVNAERKRRSDRLIDLDDIYIKSNEKLRHRRDEWRTTAAICCGA